MTTLPSGVQLVALVQYRVITQEADGANNKNKPDRVEKEIAFHPDTKAVEFIHIALQDVVESVESQRVAEAAAAGSGAPSAPTCSLEAPIERMSVYLLNEFADPASRDRGDDTNSKYVLLPRSLPVLASEVAVKTLAKGKPLRLFLRKMKRSETEISGGEAVSPMVSPRQGYNDSNVNDISTLSSVPQYPAIVHFRSRKSSASKGPPQLERDDIEFDFSEQTTGEEVIGQVVQLIKHHKRAIPEADEARLSLYVVNTSAPKKTLGGSKEGSAAQSPTAPGEADARFPSSDPEMNQRYIVLNKTKPLLASKVVRNELEKKNPPMFVVKKVNTGRQTSSPDNNANGGAGQTAEAYAEQLIGEGVRFLKVARMSVAGRKHWTRFLPATALKPTSEAMMQLVAKETQEYAFAMDAKEREIDSTEIKLHDTRAEVRIVSAKAQSAAAAVKAETSESNEQKAAEEAQALKLKRDQLQARLNALKGALSASASATPFPSRPASIDRTRSAHQLDSGSFGSSSAAGGAGSSSVAAPGELRHAHTTGSFDPIALSSRGGAADSMPSPIASMWTALAGDVSPPASRTQTAVPQPNTGATVVPTDESPSATATAIEDSAFEPLAATSSKHTDPTIARSGSVGRYVLGDGGGNGDSSPVVLGRNAEEVMSPDLPPSWSEEKRLASRRAAEAAMASSPSPTHTQLQLEEPALDTVTVNDPTESLNPALRASVRALLAKDTPSSPPDSTSASYFSQPSSSATFDNVPSSNEPSSSGMAATTLGNSSANTAFNRTAPGAPRGPSVSAHLRMLATDVNMYLSSNTDDWATRQAILRKVREVRGEIEQDQRQQQLGQSGTGLSGAMIQQQNPAEYTPASPVAYQPTVPQGQQQHGVNGNSTLMSASAIFNTSSSPYRQSGSVHSPAHLPPHGHVPQHNPYGL